MLVGPAGLYIRSRLAETPEFLAAEHPEATPIRELLSKHPLALVLAIGASIISNSSFYILLYIPTYGQKTLGLPAYSGFTATLVGGVVLAAFCPLFGHWSDKISRLWIMVVTAWLFVLTSWPCFFLMASWPRLGTCIFVVAWLQLLKAGYSGVLPSLLGEQFPVATRAIGVSLSFSTAVTIFGGFAVHRDLADRRDRRPVVAKLLPGRDRRHERRGAGNATAAVGAGGADEAGGVIGVMQVPRSRSRVDPLGSRPTDMHSGGRRGGGAGKTEGQPHASPAELAIDTLGQSVRLVSGGQRAEYPHLNIWLCNENKCRSN